MLKTVAVVSWPKTLPRRLTLLGSMFILVGALIPDVPVAGFVTCAGLGFFLLAFGVVVSPRSSERRLGRLAFARYRIVLLLRALGLVVITAVGIMAAFYAIAFAPGVFAFLAASGNGGFGGDSAGLLGHITIVAGVVTLGILLWPPQLFFRLQLDIDGSGCAQRVLLKLITATACGLTGIDILLLHFGGGPLSRVGVGPLIAGMIGTMVLLAPLYRSLARACWLHGIAGLVYRRTLRRHLSGTSAELREALERAAGQGANHIHQPQPTARKTPAALQE
jgi:hypothetical protein